MLSPTNFQMTDTTYEFLAALPRADADAVCTTCGAAADRHYDGGDAFCEPCVVTAVGIWITTCPTCGAGPDQPCAMTDHGYDRSLIHIARERVWDNRRGICPTCRATEGQPCVGYGGRIRVHVHAPRMEPTRLKLNP